MKDKKVKEIISEYMREIGSRGGKKSKRKLTKAQSRAMNKARWDKEKKRHKP